jgi:hypothetical protein
MLPPGAYNGHSESSCVHGLVQAGTSVPEDSRNTGNVVRHVTVMPLAVHPDARRQINVHAAWTVIP